MRIAANEKRGFTIVELLIVIVVISLLAVVAMIAYSGMQQRAKNTARISSASKFMKVIGMYAASNGTAPLLSAIPANDDACLGTDNKDLNGNGIKDCYTYNSVVYISSIPMIDSLLSTTGSYGPANYPSAAAGGAVYTSPVLVNYRSLIGGRLAQLQLRYYLEGVDIDCKIATVYPTAPAADGTPTYTASGHANSGTILGNLTACVVDLSQY